MAGLENAKDALKEAVILPVKFPQFFTGWYRAQTCIGLLSHNERLVSLQERVGLCVARGWSRAYNAKLIVFLACLTGPREAHV